MVEGAGTSGEYTDHQLADALKSIRGWLQQQQRAHEQITRDVAQLTRDVATLTATVTTLHENQQNLVHEQRRPIPWGAIIGGLSLVGICAGLLIAPMQRNIDDMQEFDKAVMLHIEEDARAMGAVQMDIKWLERMEQRIWEMKHDED